MNARALFLGADGRPHAPWRLVLFLGLSSLCVFASVVILKPVLTSLEGFIGLEGTTASYGTVVALLLAHLVTFHTYDRRPWSFVWLDRSAARPRPLIAGTVLGAAPIAVATLVLVSAGWLVLEPSADGSSLAMALKTFLLLLPAALSEELLSRGYLFATLREWLGGRTAIVATSLGFGVLHIWNPNATAMSIVLVTLAGLYLAVVLLVTQSMYAAWLAHFAWNWVMAALLHVPVSGIRLDPPDYRIVDAGPDWVTGGLWGPEGGAAAGVGMLAGLAFLYWRRFGLRTSASDPTAKSLNSQAQSNHLT